MRRLLFGLIVIPVMASGGVFAAEPQVSGSDPGSPQPSQADAKPTASVKNTTSPKKSPPPGSKTSQQVSRTRSDGRSGPGSLTLPTENAYASEHAAGLPVLSAPKPAPAPPANNSWTGFYIGAGVGAGMAQP
jgi:hypothetical protein